MMRRVLVSFGDSFYYSTLARELKYMKTVLDVGCGSWSPLENVKKKFYSVGIDIHRPSIHTIKKRKIHDNYRVGDIANLKKYFRGKTFDAVIALDVVEHFKKKEGQSIIEQMESIAKKKVIILTPFGFTPQHPIGGNPYQEHKSGWYINDFKKRGYKVYGMRGFRFIRTGEYATIKYKPWILWGILAVLSQYISYFIPTTAYQLLAIKKINQ